MHGFSWSASERGRLTFPCSIKFSFCFIIISYFQCNFSSPWGEHEIDYVLFFCVPNKSALTTKPHPDEVDDIKWVTKEKLLEMMDDKSLLFSPWFRLIAKKWMLNKGGWWENLQETMTTDKHCDFVNIHRFDPPKEHLGGAGDAGPLFEGQAIGDQS